MSKIFLVTALFLPLVLGCVARSTEEAEGTGGRWKILELGKNLEERYLKCRNEPRPLSRSPFCILGDLMIDAHWDKSKQWVLNLEDYLIDYFSKKFERNADSEPESCPAPAPIVTHAPPICSDNDVKSFIVSLGTLSQMSTFLPSSLRLILTNVNNLDIEHLASSFSREFEVNQREDCKSRNCLEFDVIWPGCPHAHASLIFANSDGETTSILAELNFKGGVILAIEGNIFDEGIQLVGILTFFEITSGNDKTDAITEILKLSKTIQGVDVEQIWFGREGEVTADGTKIGRYAKQGELPNKISFRKFIVIRTNHVLVGFDRATFEKCKFIGERIFSKTQFMWSEKYTQSSL